MADTVLDTKTVKNRLKEKGFDSDLAELLAESATAKSTTGERFAKIETDVGWIKLIGGAIVAALVWLAIQTYDTNARLDRIETILEERLPRSASP